MKNGCDGPLAGSVLVELLVALAVIALLCGPMAISGEESLHRLAHGEADRLSSWFVRSLSWASRYRQDLSILIRSNVNSSSLASSVLLSFPGGSETFQVDSRLKFKTHQSGTLTSQYSWGSRTVSPAFVLTFYDSRNESLGESLTVSVRGYVTRSCSYED